MYFASSKTGALATGLFLFCLAVGARGEPIVPSSDDQVIEVLPASSGNRAEERQQRRQLAARPDDPELAVKVARRYLDQAHALGDPRFAGLALAALSPWPQPVSAPDDVLLLQATLQQYLHEFDASAASLESLVARPSYRGQPQAWLTLATVRRVQGRYAASDAACERVGSAGAALHSRACLAENAALRGDVAAARTTLDSLLREPRLPPATQAWLLTTLAELEERENRAAPAEAAYRAALKLAPDTYTTLAYADFLIAQKRPAEALQVLRDESRSDAVLLRLAIAGRRANLPGATRDIAEMRERIVLANQRPEARALHGREQAMFALAIDGDAERAFELARGDVALQREALDVLVFAQAARATGRAAALDEVRRLQVEMGLHDKRLEAVLKG